MLDVVARGALDFARMNGPGLALAARSDGLFCVDFLGFVATG